MQIFSIEKFFLMTLLDLLLFFTQVGKYNKCFHSQKRTMNFHNNHSVQSERRAKKARQRKVCFENLGKMQICFLSLFRNENVQRIVNKLQSFFLAVMSRTIRLREIFESKTYRSFCSCRKNPFLIIVSLFLSDRECHGERFVFFCSKKFRFFPFFDAEC